MTSETTTVLHCDRPDCGTLFGPTPYSRQQTRGLARQFGWVTTGADSDFCPAHKTQTRQKDTA